MFSVDREKMIYNYLKEHDTATTEVLSEITGASLATIRRDLNQMHQQGKILKKYGGAQYIPPEKVNLTARRGEIPKIYADKDAIARLAAELIQDHNTILGCQQGLFPNRSLYPEPEGCHGSHYQY